MHHVRVRLHVAADGTITGHAPGVLPAGEHDAEIMLRVPEKASTPAVALAAVRGLQDELARLPVLDPRTPDELLGYDEAGLFS